MKTKPIKSLSEAQLDAMALKTSDIKTMSPAMHQRWEAAKRTGKRSVKAIKQRSGNSDQNRSRIVPVSIDPLLLKQVDRYARAAGISRSRLVAEGLQMRIQKS